MSQILSFVTLLALVILLGVLFFKVMVVFLVPLFLAVLLVIMFRPLHHRIENAIGGRGRLAALLTTSAILLIVLIPLSLVVTFAMVEGISLATSFDSQKVKERVVKLRRDWGLEIPLNDRQQRMSEQFERLVQSALSTEAITQFEATKNQQVVQSLGSELADLETVLQKTATGAAAADQPPPQDDSATALEPAPTATPYLEDLPTADKAQAALERLPVVRQLVAELEREQLSRGDPGYLSKVHEAQLAYQQVREAIVGSSARLWLADLVNPGSDHLARMRTQSMEEGQSWLLTATSTAFGVLGGMVAGMVIIVLALYFFLADGPNMVDTVMHLVPVDERYKLQMLEQFERISRAVVGATLLSAVVQAALAGVGYYMAGVESVFLLTLLTGLLAFVPFLGAAGVWFPVCLWLFFFEDRVTAAILLAIYGTFVVSLADNVIKPLVLHGQSKLHPLVALLSILGGIQVLGPIGVLIGPMAASLLQAGLNILRLEVESFRSREETAEEPAESAATAEPSFDRLAGLESASKAPAEKTEPEPGAEKKLSEKSSDSDSVGATRVGELGQDS